ncbi:MAG TPA: FecR domain-containing protein [Candidatus Udaeobacter sp.]|nr:FecR domain-containing protein [Candidatus Udaeobacter sp.]
MREFLTKTFSSKPITVCGVLFILIAPTRLANADPLKEARVSQVIQDVRLLEAHAAPHPAAVNDQVTLGSAVRTGVESRAELTFKDLTITRLGANTIFSFTAGARQAELTHGTILLQVPPNAPAVRANTTSVTVSVMGGTALLATGPPTKFMVLEGTGTIYPLGHPEKAVTVHGGEMVTAEDGRISNPEEFDVKLVLATSALIMDFAPLTNLPLIQMVVEQQIAGESVLIATSNRLPSQSMIDTIDVTDQSANSNPAVVEVRTETPTPSPTISPTITPAPTPSKFGTPSTITAPNPYLITSGTTITTDPSITTNGVTDFGKIYRGAMDDGPFSLWAFGSTSAFDNAINLDTDFFADPNHLPIVAFKFQNLSLNGNPTIDISNGGVTKLALIGVNGITSGPPGGTLTFTGLDLLALATVNGSINLTSDVSFQNLNELAMYARGAGSNLTLNSPISNIGALYLAAEGSIQLTNPGTMSVGAFEATAGNNLTLQIGGSLLLNGKVRLDTLVLPGTTVANGANVTLNITGDYTNTSATEFSLLRVRNDGAHIGTGGNIGVNIGGDLTTGSDFSLAVQNTNGLIDNGGNITLTVGGSISTHGQLSLLVENYDGSANPAGHIGTGGNISVTTGGDLTADSIDAFINNRNGGMIDSGGNLTFNIGGALTTQHDALTGNGQGYSLFLLISNRDDGGGGGTIGSNVALNLNANSASIGGNMGVFVTTNGVSSRISAASLNIDITNDFAVRGDADIEIQNFPGTIDTDATIGVTAANITANSLLAEIDNSNGGTIGASANISFATGGDFATSVADATFTINNTAGTITNNANLALNAGGSISTAGELSLLLENYDESANPAGHIGGSANVSLITRANLTADFASIAINNRNGGRIDSSASLILNIGGALTTLHNGTDFLGNVESLTLDIANRYVNTLGSTIGSGATLDFHASSASIGGNLVANIGDIGGTIGGNALLNFSVTQGVTVQGDGIWQILNDSRGPDTGDPSPIGGTIHGNATLQLSANNLTANSLLVRIENENGGVTGPGGTIDSSANITFNLSGTLTTQTDAGFEIRNNYAQSGPGGIGGSGGTIGQDAVLNVNANSLSIGGVLDTSIHNGRNAGDNGGTIGGNATINLVVVGGIAALDDSQFIGNGGGTIGSNAAIIVTAASLATTDTTPGALSASINNSGGGNIGDSANINFDLSGNLTSESDANFTIDNSSGGRIGSDATVSVGAANITANSLSANINNSIGGAIGATVNISLATGGDFATSVGDATFTINNTAGTITNDANLALNAGGSISTAGELGLLLENYDESANPAGHIGGSANVSLTTGGNLTADSMSMAINNRGGGVIGSGVNLTVNIGGALTTLHDGPDFIGNDESLSLGISSRYDNGTAGSFIGGDATLLFHSDSASIGGHLAVITSDRGGTIDGNALLNFNVTHDITVQAADTTNQDAASWEILNDSGDAQHAGTPIGGTIHGSAILLLSTASLTVPAGSFDVSIYNKNGGVPGSGGTIDSDATIAFILTGDLTTQQGAFFGIQNQLQLTGTTGGTIGGNATVNVTAANFSVGGVLDVDIANLNNGSGSSSGGSIGANAAVNFNADNNVSSGSAAYFQILNESLVAGSPGGFIGGDATVDVSVGNVAGGPDQNSNALVAQIDNRGGSIGGNAFVNLAASGNVNAQGNAFLQVLNFNDGASGPGTIGGDATINVSAASITANFLIAQIDNTGGAIGGNALINANVSGTISTLSDADFQIFNENNGSGGGSIGLDATVNVTAANISTGGSLFAEIFNSSGGSIGASGGSIGGGAMIDVAAANITANSLFAEIDNTGGSIGASTEAGAAINMNVSGTASVTTDATVAIYGSDGAGSAAININGPGSYNAGGTFLTYIDGNGQITFNNATAHADVLKAGVFGANGVLNINGGMLSADTELKLYAPGSNGTLNFLSNVTLGGSALTKILAANTINILDNVVVTIGGPNMADVYTNNANYTGFGGNGTRTGTFAGAGAHDPLPLDQAPPFGPATPSHHTNGGAMPRPPRFSEPRQVNRPPQLNVSNTEQLLALLDGAGVGPDGKVTVPASKGTKDLGNSSRTNINVLPREARRILMQQTRDTTRESTRVGTRRL